MYGNTLYSLSALQNRTRISRAQPLPAPSPPAAMKEILFFLLVSRAAAHGGLTIPVPRNNYGPMDPANWTRHTGQQYQVGGPCAGDACLWFNEGS